MTTISSYFDSSTLQIIETSSSGRGLYASRDICKGELLVKCEEPFATVILREFRKEVCAFCYQWRFSNSCKSWNSSRILSYSTEVIERISRLYGRLDSANSVNSVNELQSSGRNFRRHLKPSGGGLWFCGAECRQRWTEEVDLADLLLYAFDCLEAAFAAQSDLAETEAESEAEADAERSRDSSELTEEQIATEWRKVAEWYAEFRHVTAVLSESGTKHRALRHRRTELAARYATRLSSDEFDTARFVTYCLFKKFLHSLVNSDVAQQGENVEKCTNESATISLLGIPKNSLHPSRATLLTEFELFNSLQSNYISRIRQFPQLVASHISVFAFLATQLPTYLVAQLSTEFFTSALGKEFGNSFGLWGARDSDSGEDCEFLGYSVYPMASLFNHSCSPNVMKRREGRGISFRAAVEIPATEDGNPTQLYIDYGNSASLPFAERQRKLHTEWDFLCNCKRCAMAV